MLWLARAVALVVGRYDYTIFERGHRAGTFFNKYPVHRMLNSYNRRNTRTNHPGTGLLPGLCRRACDCASVRPGVRICVCVWQGHLGQGALLAAGTHMMIDG